MAKDKEKTVPQRGSSARLSRTEQRQKDREREQRRRRIVVTAIAVFVVVAIGAAVLIASNSPADAPIPDTAARYDALDGTSNAQTVTEKGYPRIGSLDGIPVTLYTSFGCDDCNVFHTSVLPRLVDRVEEGDISLTYVPLRGGTVSNFNGATRSALCAARQSEFFQYADALVHWQDLYGGSAFSDNRLQTGAANLGLDKSQFDTCRSSAPENAVFQNGATDAGARDADFTPPAVFVNNVAVTNSEGAPSTDIIDINRVIDDAIDFRTGGGADESTPEPTGEPTADATEEATAAATDEPTAEATEAPTAEPTAADTDAPAETATP